MTATDTTFQIDGGRLWTMTRTRTLKHSGGLLRLWEDEARDFQIIEFPSGKTFRLVSFIHETGDEGNFRHWDHRTMQAAAEAAERM